MAWATFRADIKPDLNADETIYAFHQGQRSRRQSRKSLTADVSTDPEY
jgi:hypothetical protein